LYQQIVDGLGGVSNTCSEKSVIIGYEHIWAIGPGETPPSADYIDRISQYVKKVIKDLFGFSPLVVYGGGVKLDNAAMLGRIRSLNGGLIALTKFSPPLAFSIEELDRISNLYVETKEKYIDSCR